MTPTEAVLWIALNIFFEARGEPYIGKIAVGLVVIHRAKICGDTVEQTIKRSSQFSWTTAKQVLNPLDPGQAQSVLVFSRCLVAAKMAAALAATSYDFTEGATYYHRSDIFPYWASSKQEVGRWGAHLYYKGSPGDREFCAPSIVQIPSVFPAAPAAPAAPGAIRQLQIRQAMQKISSKYL